MNQHDQELPASLGDLPTSLPRSCSNPDLTKLCRRRSSASQSHVSSRCSDTISENSQVLYMADSRKTSKARQNRQSLSSVSNCVDRKFDGSSDDKKENTHKDDALSWDVIDQEIYEWQYVCQTGRPFWWSPESKYARLNNLKKYQPGLMNEPEPGPRQRKRERDRPKAAYAERRRAVSDNYFCDRKTINDLAHLIAVQLLGACFTLPPDRVLAIPSPNCTIEKISARLPDPRMISSLRMHTQFRYTPSFGHQARDTSPVQAWTRASRKSSPGVSSPIADIVASASPVRQKGRRRTLNLTDGSGSYGSLDSDGYRFARSGSSNDGPDPEYNAVHRSPGTSHQSFMSMMMPHSKRQVTEPEHLRRKMSGRLKAGETKAFPENASQETKYRLEPVIRSEPHHVFIQPVRELVVKRWTNFKRRLSGSLHSALPTRGTEDQESASETGSPAASSGRKARRLRAQERGDIHSSDAESPPHFNTPASGHQTPTGGLATPDRINGATFQLSNPSNAEADLAAAERRAASSQSPAVRSRKQPSESSIHPVGYQDPAPEPLSTAPSRPAFPTYSPARLKSPPGSHYFSPRRRPNRQKRKSTLSEMYTVHDIRVPGTDDGDFDGISSAPATANVTPMEKEEQELGLIASNPAIPILKDPAVSVRPRLGRTSTSGTQIFTTRGDGIELDGLPVGPPEETWIGQGRRERTYL